ncbi:MAG: CDP-alcohol phosphatidyltransferase family protein [Candidatus Methanoperedens sp.]|nr:CDP-alcohol phosphatidyltransferase family protein [Candidatus Methanoperedens sp.]
MIDDLKESIQDALNPFARRITEINPNTLTLVGLALSLISAFFFAKQQLVWAGGFLLASGFFDALDGLVARANNRTTKYGGFLDSVCDRFADAAVIIGAMYGGLTQLYSIPFWITGTLAIFGSLMVSYTRARAEAAGAKASIGVADRPARMIILIIGAFIDMVNFAIFAIAVLSFITIFQRIAHVKKTLK